MNKFNNNGKKTPHGKIFFNVILFFFFVAHCNLDAVRNYGSTPKQYDISRCGRGSERRGRDVRNWRIAGSTAKSCCSCRDCVAGGCGFFVGGCLGMCVNCCGLADYDASPQEKMQQTFIVPLALGTLVSAWMVSFGKKKKLKKE
jgi:hypothetical protein